MTAARPILASATAIAPLDAREGERLALEELDAFLAVVDALQPGELDLPTHCSLWSVRDIVSHQAAHVQMGSGVRGMLAQLDPRLTMPYVRRRMSMLVAINQAQVDRRRERPFSEVVAELRDGMPRSIRGRSRPSLVARLLRVPAPPAMMTVEELHRVIFTRDMWCHRLDLCDATGREFVTTADHDGPLVEQLVRDMAAQVVKRANGLHLALEVRGPGGGAWSMGSGATIELAMDIPTLLRRSSERITAAQALPAVESSLDDHSTLRALAAMVAPF